ncbi:cation-translocating P-type ATPase [Streptomyces longispororuber]|uniref:cation-translocating P-type ATPase n=1 Tax=Streptomyces longispororuber TaxID=68230 RepID=UPI00210E43F9|nr:cation-translocating P-type ATPase [Streptomyces longispororuber]MCQ4208067.1 cation-translocating P-type ATPase [Streptomyces longispororuber]
MSTLFRPLVAGRRGAQDSRVRIRGERAHIAVRGLQGAREPSLTRSFEERLGAVPGVRWVAVNSHLGHVVAAVEGTVEQDKLLATLREAVEAVEGEHGEDAALPDHPLAPRAAREAELALAAHVAALPVALLARLAGRTPIPAVYASVLSALEAHPRLRGSVERRLGLHDTEFARALLSAGVNALSGVGPGIGVDATRHALRLRELLAHQAAWRAAEPRLTDSAGRFAAAGVREASREVPLRAGPVERYAVRAETVAAASFGGALAMTGRPLHAAQAVVSVIPKAPWLAREAFASVLGRGLSRSGSLVVRPAALRRLDRVDVAILDTDALMTGAHLLTDLLPLEEAADAGELAAVAHRLFTPGRLDRAREDGPWRLAPMERCPSPEPATSATAYAAYTDARARLERNGARRILGLVRDGRLLALVGVVPEVDEAASALIAAAERSGLTVLITPGDSEPPGGRRGDQAVEGGEHLVASVRAAQRDGSGVLLLSRRRDALAAADVGIGVTGDAGEPPWGADVHVGTDLGRAAVLLAACKPARSVSGWGVRLAQASAGVGLAMTAVQTARRPLTRFLLTVNGAAAVGLGAGVWSASRVLTQPLPVSAARRPWHAMDPATVLARTGSRAEGLTADQVKARTRWSGRAAPRPSLARAFVTETANPLTPVLVGGAALSAAVGAVLDASMILAVTAVSGLIGGTQRYLAERTAARLYHRAVIPARAVRDGAETELAAEGLVVGDVVVLHAGDVVPADCRLLTADGVEADESALTGESLPVSKSTAPVLAHHPAERTSMVYEGTTLAAGHARAVAVATGEATEAGRGARFAAADAPRTGVEHRLGQITRAALPAALASAGAVVAAGLFRGRPVRETIGAAVGLAVASVPEGLPFLVTAAQLAAVRRLAEHGVLVRDARTIEAAGRADVLCFDKTGTLTHGRLELVSVHADGRTLPLDSREAHHRAVLAAGLRATPRARGSRRLTHVTDQAIGTALREAGIRRDTAAPGWKLTATLPFEPSRGFHAALGRSRDGCLLSVKGAPEQVVDLCATRDGRALNRAGRRAVLAEGQKLAAAGHRVLAVAERRAPAGAGPAPDDTELTDEDVAGLDFLGFLVLVDQVRGSAQGLIRRLAKAGVHIVMITGDHPDTAEAIARELGVVDGHTVVSGADLDDLDDDKLTALLPTVGVVARATPHHKVRVVRAFQSMGRTVAMTGDGANDAPAIRLADVGIAFGHRATPAARAAADLVVTNGRLEPVLATLVEGRALWVTVRQALAVLVGGNLGEIAFAVSAAALTGQSPLTARQLLLVNLFTDLAPAVAVATRTPRGTLAEGSLHEGPDISLGAALARETGVRAGATALAALAGWLVARASGRAARARTVALLALVGAQLGQTLVTAPKSPTVVTAALGSAVALAAVVQTPGVSQFFGCTPLGPLAWATAAIAAVAGTVASGLSLHLVRDTSAE